MKKEFKSVFQITKMITFEVNYYTLGNNNKPYFTTSAQEFIRSKRDYKRCGQCQKDVLNGVAKSFYNYWDNKHLQDLTQQEYNKLIIDLEKLKERYNHIYIEQDTFKGGNRDIRFREVVELSKQDLKKI